MGDEPNRERGLHTTVHKAAGVKTMNSERAIFPESGSGFKPSSYHWQSFSPHWLPSRGPHTGGGTPRSWKKYPLCPLGAENVVGEVKCVHTFAHEGKRFKSIY